MKKKVRIISAKIPVDLYEDAKKMCLNISAICRAAIEERIKKYSKKK